MELHEKLSKISAAKRLSLNQLCILLLNRGLDVSETGDWPEFEPVIKKVRDRFQEGLLGIVLFGSRATGEATVASDIDLLVILDDSIQIDRALYRWWDDEIIWREGELNPHFVNYPGDVSSASGLWFEVAISGNIIYQKGGVVEQLFLKLKDFIADGNVRRYISNGHPYWVRRRADEK